MCGIVGYIGQKEAQPILLQSLAKLEYRGYDSCGVALASPGLTVHKDAVRVADLARSLPRSGSMVGIGHTRWATHGAPCKINAHPQTDCTGRIAIVHNGVISNYQKLRQDLIREGHHFSSETDTEVIAHLIEKYYRREPGTGLKEAVETAIRDIQGSFAIIVLAEGESDLVVARRDSPLIVGLGDRENYVASDVPAVLDYTSRVIYLEDGDIGVISTDAVRLYHEGREVRREEQKVLWGAEAAQKGGYEHFMLKEIHEQPRIIRDTISEYLTAPEPVFDLSRLSSSSEPVLLLACGTSYFAATIGKYIAENLLNTPVRAEIASEFVYYRNCPAVPVGIGVTQSGETADTLKAMKRLKEAGARVIAVTNVVGSTASKIAHQTVYMRAGPEISVAATKSFMAQLVALYWLALSRAQKDVHEYNQLVLKLRQLPDKVQRVLDTEGSIAAAGQVLADYENVFYIGRGLNLGVAMEGALKLKEVSYIHSEAYAAGEIKHGPFALLSPKTPVVAIVAQDSSHDAMLTNIKQIKARGSPVLAIAEEGDDSLEDMADTILTVPETGETFSPFVNTVVVQLLAYYAAKKRGCPIDFPRNLAKSVTVE